MFFSKRIILPFLVLLLIFSCGETKKAEVPKAEEKPTPIVEKGHDKESFPSGTFKDERDNHEYKTVKIGKREWLAENLQYKTKYSVCYDDHPFNCRKYGRLYTWYDAMEACPKGWRMPDHTDWMSLNKRFYQNAGLVYDALKMNGEAGFNAQMGGWKVLEGSYYSLDKKGGYWSQKKIKEETARYYLFSQKDEKFYRKNSNTMAGFSCRCVRDVKKG